MGEVASPNYFFPDITLLFDIKIIGKGCQEGALGNTPGVFKIYSIISILFGSLAIGGSVLLWERVSISVFPKK